VIGGAAPAIKLGIDRSQILDFTPLLTSRVGIVPARTSIRANSAKAGA
jgi:hypothetical protein